MTTHARPRCHTRVGRWLVVTSIVLSLGALATCAGPARKTTNDKVASTPVASRPAPPTYECRFTEEAIEIDGRADEAVWSRAQVIDRFMVPWLGPNARAPYTATRARLLWDREYFYFFAELDDSDLYADVTEHDGMTWNNDVFELFFKPADDKPGYYEFQVNPANTTMDLFMPRRGAGAYPRFKDADKFDFKTAVQLRGTLNHWQDKDQGWSVEGRLRWRDFVVTGGRPNVDEQWKFALCRYDFSVEFEGPELSTCAPLSRVDFHRYEDYALLKFVGPNASTAARPFGIDHRVAWTTSHVVGSPDPAPPYQVQRVYDKLKITAPIAIAQEPNASSLLIIQQAYPWGGNGQIVRVVDDLSASAYQVLLDLNDVAYGVAFHPDFPRNGYLYVGSNGPNDSKNKKTRVVRYTIDRAPPHAIVPDSKKLIIEWDSDGHNGGDLAFGKDGLLYITAGDGTSDSDRNLTAQDLSSLTGSVVRIDVDHPDDGKAYSVPKDNPFLATLDARPEIWAYGLRNPWRISIDRPTGDVWVGNNGQDLWEQVYLIARGANYGWSLYEGSHPFYLNRKQGPTPISGPIVEHAHSEARSLTGGLVYHGDSLKALDGAYVYGDWSTGRIWGVRHKAGKVVWHVELARTTLQITGFGLTSKGDLLITDHGNGGGIYRLVPTPTDQPRSPFPTRLSETGLFTSTATNTPDPALIPYSVNAALWSDGAHKERFIALPGDSTIDFTTWRGWNFPEGAVLVKTFALDMEAGNPASRKRIETRLLAKTGGQWVGYSYEWNDAQTDAMLVAGEGKDKTFKIKDAQAANAAGGGGDHEQVWRYPSRTECMVCHSRAANFVLGLSELQMNREHDYGGVKDNQLRVLEHLGMLRVDWASHARNEVKQEAKDGGMSEEEANQYVNKQLSTRLQREAPKSALLATRPQLYRKLVDPYDKSADLDARVRSYLQVNCSVCHVEAGGGNAQMELEFTTKLADTRLLDVVPYHDKLGIEDARLIAPGDPDRSVLLQRVSRRGAGQMPPLATRAIDEEAVKMLREWIATLKPAAAAGE